MTWLARRLWIRTDRTIDLWVVRLLIPAHVLTRIILRVVLLGWRLLLNLSIVLWVVLILLLSRVLRTERGLLRRLVCVLVATLYLLHRPTASVLVVSWLSRILSLSRILGLGLTWVSTILPLLSILLIALTGIATSWSALVLTALTIRHCHGCGYRRLGR